MAKKDKLATVVDQNLPPPEIEGKAEQKVPDSPVERLANVQEALRSVRFQLTQLIERRQTLEKTATELLAELSLLKKQKDFLDRLNPHEIELLKKIVVAKPPEAQATPSP